MFYVYVLYSSEHNRFYVGSSSNPDKRLQSHNQGRVRSTKAYRPWQRISLEMQSDREAMLKRERYLKSGWGHRELNQMLEGWLSGLKHRS